ncbi:MAG: EAL domain-containing protein [Butyrivibrio sp.]|nr:EAL domain-containing protein [Butyrivibrio sp.]
MKNNVTVDYLANNPDKIKFAYQPIVNASDDSIFGYEALMRPEPFTPIEFITEMAKRDQLQIVEEITNYYSIKYFLEKKLPGKMFMNTFPATCMRPEWCFKTQEVGNTAMIGRIVYEILEYTTPDSFSFNVKRNFINNSGVQAELAIDDYGTGQNADLRYLDFYKPNYIKIDRKFITNIDSDPTKQEVVEQMCFDMRARNIKVLAEGVETEAEYNYLKQQPIDYLQGYYIGKPKLYTEF